jgi:S-adenosylmethionine synthetase
VTATEHLAQASSSHDALLIYISTDYVFPGVQGEAPYTPASTPKPTNIYGQTKLDGERAVQKYPKTTSLRVPVLYGDTDPDDDNAESAINVLLDALWKSQKEPGVKMDDWAIRTPTNTADVGRVCVDIARYAGAGADTGRTVPPILQFSSDDRMTKYEVCRVFGEIMALPLDGIVAVKDGGKPGPDGTMRPYDCHMDTGELKKMGISVETVDFVAWWRKKLGAFRH